MKTIFIICWIFILNNCNQPGIASWSHNTLKGEDAIKEILNAGNFIDTAYYSSASNSNPGSTSSMSIYHSIQTINSILMPIVSKIDKNKYYTRESVDACVKKIYALGLILDSYLTVALDCKIRETPLIDIP